MIIAHRIAKVCTGALVGAAIIAFGTSALAQPAAWSASPYGSYSQPRWPLPVQQVESAAENVTAAPAAPRTSVARGPLARLVFNSDTSGGEPPFALADQAGTIQRLVEPVPGIDLTPYVGSIVTVRHDTGRTLLATQLELPPPPLLPMIVEAPVSSTPAARLENPMPPAAPPQAAPSGARRIAVRPVRFIDHDDSTVELIDDQDALPAELSEGGSAAGSSMASESQLPIRANEYPAVVGPVLDGSPYGTPAFAGAECGDPLACDLMGGDASGAWGQCPHCGGFHGRPPYDLNYDEYGYGPEPHAALGPTQSPLCRFYADIEINFLRLHMMDGAVGKLSEKYEFSPRFTVGFEGTGLIDGRIRYWRYDRGTEILGGGGIRVEFDVLDIEATYPFRAGRSSVGLSAGLRLAHIDLIDDDDEVVGNDLIGMTLAADARTPLCPYEGGEIAWVYGGRLSILGGDWGGDPASDFIPVAAQDDNVVADELYVGVEYATGYRGCNLRARLAFEMQNWHSDAMAQNSGTDSIGFLGPGVRFGAEY